MRFFASLRMTDKGSLGMAALVAVIAGLTGNLFTACTQKPETEDLVSCVDTRIGTGGHGHVFVGADVPFGMVQLGPTSIPQTWDWCSGYHASDSTVIGFSHTHLSGTGIGDLFDVTVMPVVGEVAYARDGMWSYADRTKEVTEPGYYSVPLLRYGITAELSATERVGIHRYTFPASEEAALVFDLENGGCWDKATDTHFDVVDDCTLQGWRHSTGWAKDQKQFFYAVFSKPVSVKEEGMYARCSFAAKEGEKVLLKVALSPNSCDAAKAAMEAELPAWDFDAVRSNARAKWNDVLAKVRIDTDDEAARKVFYTALYHTMIAPSLFSDIDQKPSYTTYSLWDTYRAAMPLYYILHPELRADVVNTMLDIFDAQGKLPVWHLVGNETDCMVGNPGVISVADAIVKQLPGIDYERAYAACKASVMLDERGQGLRKQYGYIPCDLYGEACGNDMEYAIADAAVAHAAAVLGYTQDAAFFTERSHSWRHYFDPSTGFVRGRTASGGWRTPFDPFTTGHLGKDYTEGNAWQYTWLVPQDLKGLMDCFGGRNATLEHLDSLFTAPEKVGPEAPPDITGLIGQYVHGNEPSHHIAYFYTMLGQPWKTADLVRKILSEQYGTGYDGLAGNEDVGQMSAWYILSSLGFYQVEPACQRFWFGSPIFRKAELTVAGGTFTIEAPATSDANRYIQRIFLNGKLYTKPYIDFADIDAGGTLRFEMGAEPVVWYAWEDYFNGTPDRRPAPEKRLFTSDAVEKTLTETAALLENPKLRQMFINCFPNTLDTTVHFDRDEDGNPDTFVWTGDIPAMWLRDSGAQVWHYVQLASQDAHLADMIKGTLLRQFKCLVIDPYANAFNPGPTNDGWHEDNTYMVPDVFERKWELDSECYPIRLAYAYWKETGDTSVFGDLWTEAMKTVLGVMREQQKYDGLGKYCFSRQTDRQFDTKGWDGYGAPLKPCGLIASAFRPSDDSTVLDFLIPSNFMAVSSLRKAAEILSAVNGESGLAAECTALADQVEAALKANAIVNHPVFGPIYAYEVDGFGNALLQDDSNVPSLLSLAYLIPEMASDPVWQNTRRFVLSEYNPCFFRGAAGEGVGGPHIGYDMVWPMSIMMRAFTATDDEELRDCVAMLLATDAGTGFIHESFHKDNASHFTREWFAWQNSLFGELILKLVNDGKLELLNSIR